MVGQWGFTRWVRKPWLSDPLEMQGAREAVPGAVQGLSSCHPHVTSVTCGAFSVHLPRPLCP